MKLIYFLTILLFLSGNAQNYTVKTYNTDSGLPQNSIKDIVKDKYGFIWLSTDIGILRYDGNNFVQYKNFNFGNLSFADFLGTAKNDSLVIFNNLEAGSLLISGRQAKAIPANNSLNPLSYPNHKIIQRCWKNSMTRDFFPSRQYFIQLQNGSYYFDNKGIVYVDKNKVRKKIDLQFSIKRLKQIFVHEDHVFISDAGNKRLLQLYKGNLSEIQADSVYSDPGTKLNWQQTTGQVFIINKGNIYKSEFRGGKLHLTFLVQYKDIVEDAVSSMFYDETYGKLYIGGLIKGFRILSISNFLTSQKNVPFENEATYALLPFKKNSIITKEGIEYYKNSTERIYTSGMEDEKRWLLYDHAKNIVYKENNSIYIRYKDSQYKKYDSIAFNNTIQGVFNSEGVYSAVFRDNNVWHFSIFRKDNFRQIISTISFKVGINAVLKYNNDILYLGSDNGLFIYSVSKNKIVKQIGKEIPVKQVLRTKDGNIWVTSYDKGFYFLKDDKLLKMPCDRNNYILSTHCLVEDNGDFWIPTNNGLFRVKEKILLDYAKTQKGIVTYYRYTKENGLLNNEFNNAYPSFSRLENRQFVLPSMEGFVFFEPEKIKKYYPKPDEIYLERIKVKGEIIHFKDKLYLKSNYKSAEIYIDIPYYSNFENIYLQAKLENSEDERWTNIKSDKTYHLDKIGEGDYNLVVRFLSSENGKFIYKTIPVEIEAHFYETMSFKIFMIFILVLIVFIIIQVNTNFLKIKLRETNSTLEITQNKLKNESDYQKKLIESISHDITTPVKFIAMLSQRLNSAKDAKSQKRYFDSIYKTSDQLYKFTLSLKEYTELYKQENTSKEESKIYDLIEAKKLLFEEIAKQNNTELYNFCDENLKTSLNKNILSAIFHNIIDNAVKYTSEGKIVITTVLKESHLEISVIDTGKGMLRDQINYYSELAKGINSENATFKNYGLGLHMVIQLIEKINSKITFHENIPQGTIVKILIKYD